MDAVLNLSTGEMIAQAIIAMLLITAPPDPVKLLFFNSTIARTGAKRTAAALQVAIIVLVILGISALAGRELLQLLGIDLNVFGAVGGLVVALMGFEMLYGGEASRAEGADVAKEGPQETDGLILPLSTPLLAGPGAITTAITISSFEDSGASMLIALLAVAVVAVVVFVSFAYLGDAISRLSAQTTALLQRLGGLLLATIGTQMVLNGLKNFFAA